MQNFIKLLGNGRVKRIVFYTTPLPESRGFLFMKKYIAVFLSVILCICLFGCGKANAPDVPAKASGESQGTTENTVPYSESEKESVTENASESSQEDASKNGPINKSEDKPKVSGTTEPKTSPSQSETASAPTVISAESSTKPSSKIECTVQVECKAILGKKNKFKKDASLIPTDGVILSPVKVYLDDGEAAYDALKKACDENGIALNIQNSSFGGIYVVGIGGICEKDCGAQSGWVYTVNGQSPSTGLGNYKLKNGDTLVLSYVC